jgi:hypothetical protein
VGTLISIVNGSPGPRSAAITSLNIPLVQLSDTVSGSYSVKNTGATKTGFYPEVTTSVVGANPKKVESSLVFGGRERQNDFSYKTGYGIHVVEVAYGSSKKSQLVLTIAPWMIVLVAFIGLILGVELLLLKRRRSAARKN